MFEITGFIVIQVVLLVLGLTLGAVSALFVFLATRRVGDSRRRRLAIWTALSFPLVAVFYLEAGVVIHDVVRCWSGEDCTVEGEYHYPLTNGYRLAFFDETAPEGGRIEDPRGSSVPLVRIYSLQVAGDFVFMDADPEPQQGTVPSVIVTHGEVHPPANVEPSHLYVELNTRTHERSDYPSLEDLNRAAATRKIQLQLAPLGNFYREAVSAGRPGWLFFVVLGAPILITGVGLLRGLHKLRSR